MHRRNLEELSGQDRAQLAQLIQQYATPAVVAVHWDAVQAGVHNSPTGFLSFHRNYIAGLENHLTAQGFNQWVPLPKWNPATPIPKEFDFPDRGPGRLRNPNPGISFSPRFDQANLASFHSDEELAMALMRPHNLVHRTVGGLMNNLQHAPEAPIFWPWHAFIDDIWWDWQHLTVVVPNLTGMRLARAHLIISSIGLTKGKLSRLPVSRPAVCWQKKPWPEEDRLIVRCQSPFPAARIPRGTAVNLQLSPR